MDIAFPAPPALLLFDEIRAIASRNDPLPGCRIPDAFKKQPSLLWVLMKTQGEDSMLTLHALVLFHRVVRIVPGFVNQGNMAVVWVVLLRLSCAQLIDECPPLRWFAEEFCMPFGVSATDAESLRYYERYIVDVLNFCTWVQFTECQYMFCHLIKQASVSSRRPVDWAHAKLNSQLLAQTYAAAEQCYWAFVDLMVALYGSIYPSLSSKASKAPAVIDDGREQGEQEQCKRKRDDDDDSGPTSKRSRCESEKEASGSHSTSM